MKFLPTFADAPSGSLGGQVASHNRFGYYMRTKSIPTNPATTRQEAVRGYFGTLVNNWINVLSQNQRDGWNNYGQQVPVLDALGNPINLTGQNQYIRSNTPRLQAGLVAISNAPTTFDTGVSVVDVINATGGASAIAFGLTSGNMESEILFGGALPDDANVLIQLGPPINPTRNYYGGPYQKADTVATSASDTTEDWLTSRPLLQAIPLADGQIRPIRIRLTYDDGRLSQAWRSILPCVENP